MSGGRTRIAVLGAGGRMGRILVGAIAGSPECLLAGAAVRPGSRLTGRDAGENAGVGSLGVALADSADRALEGADVALDFSLPEATAEVLAACRRLRVPLVIGTTGLSREQEAAVEALARDVAVVRAANTSIGVTLLAGLVRRAAAVLGEGYDVEILDLHHRYKRDAPSGTALALGRAVAEGRGTTPASEMGRRPGDGVRTPGAVGFASLRAGDVAGEHTVLFAGEGERLELVHRASDRMAFARGALRAAAWVAGRAPGLYGMEDVLGLRA